MDLNALSPRLQTLLRVAWWLVACASLSIVVAAPLGGSRDVGAKDLIGSPASFTAGPSTGYPHLRRDAGAAIREYMPMSNNFIRPRQESSPSPAPTTDSGSSTLTGSMSTSDSSQSPVSSLASTSPSSTSAPQNTSTPDSSDSGGGHDHRGLDIAAFVVGAIAFLVSLFGIVRLAIQSCCCD